MISKNYRVHLLSEDDDVHAFDCGNQDLNDFIKYDASNYGEQKLAYNYVAEKSDEILAYFSLANDRVSVDDFESKTHFNRFRKVRFVNAKRLKVYPAAKLCRFAVDSKHKGCRIGTSLLNKIKLTLAYESRSACRFLLVDAYKDAIPFYEKNGFVCLKANTSGLTIPMYFDLSDIK